MQSAEELKQLLDRIDHRGYPAYKDTKGKYQFQGYVFSIDHVQGDRKNYIKADTRGQHCKMR